MPNFLNFSTRYRGKSAEQSATPSSVDVAGGAKAGSRGERGTALFLGTCALTFVIPLVGLAVDVGYLYACKSRLQSSVDGAALAAARSLNLGINPSDQASKSKQNARNWFYSNFPTSNWGTTSTIMNDNTIVVDDTTVPQLRQITITATTTVPTYFMKWFNFNSTVISAIGKASRRDVVVMIVLDRSSSMQLASGGNACPTMQAAAKLFTGQFAAGRDKIGLLSFSDGTYLHSAPTTTFQTTLGYNDGTNHSGLIDNVVCTGGTNTAQAITLAHDELRKINLPGALNIILFESDGLPNSLTMRFGKTTTVGSTTTYTSAISRQTTNVGCPDKNGLTKNAGGWASGTTTPYTEKLWYSASHSFGTGSGLTAVPAGAYGVLYAADTAATFLALGDPWHPDSNQGLGANHIAHTASTGCLFDYPDATALPTGGTDVSDFDWLPPTDVFGNQLKPSINPYKLVTMDATVTSNVRFLRTDSLTTKSTNFRNAAFNAADYAAYRARTDSTLPATMYVIGLGGYTNAPPDKVLMQRIANDPLADQFNATAAYSACTHTNSASTDECVYYSAQPQGVFIYSTDQSQLKKAFVNLSSQILRLSR